VVEVDENFFVGIDVKGDLVVCVAFNSYRPFILDGIVFDGLLFVMVGKDGDLSPRLPVRTGRTVFPLTAHDFEYP